jgi:hypothetical protein
MIFLPGSVAGSIQPLGIEGDFEVFQTSIYGVSSTVSDWLALSGFGTIPESANWQVFKSNTGGFLPTTQNDFRYGYLSGGNPSLDASLEPLSARLLVSVLGGSYYSKNVVPLKPYDSPLDIPNLQLWLDASDIDTFKDLTNDFLESSSYWNFDGTGYLTSPSNQEFNFTTGTFTIECWVRFRDFSGQDTIITNYNSGSSGWILRQYLQRFRFDLRGDNSAITGTTTLQLNTWYHVAVSGSPGAYRLFVNGVQDAVTYTGTTSFVGNILGIGDYAAGVYAGGSFRHNGDISNLRIVNGKSLYNSTFDPFEESFIPLTVISEPGVTTPLLVLQDAPVTLNYGNVDGITLSIVGNELLFITSDSYTIPFWLDKSPNALTASQTIVNNRTSLLSSEVNGLNVVNFDGVDDHFNLSSPITLSGDFSHFFVYKRRNASVISQSLGNKATGVQSSYRHHTDNLIYSGNRRTSTATVSATTLIGGLRKNEHLQVDLEPKSFITSWTSSITNRVSSLGVYNNTSYHIGPMCEVIHTGSMLPNQEIDLINKNLFDKWKVPKQVPYIKINPYIFTTSISALSATVGVWYIEPTSFNIQWQKSDDNNFYTNIPNASSVIYNPTTADYGFFVRISVSASNSVGTSLPSFSNVLQLTTQNIAPVTLQRTTIFTVSATRGTWNSTMPINLLYQYQVNTGSGWENFGTLTTSTTAYLSAYETTPVDVRVNEYAYNSTLNLPS